MKLLSSIVLSSFLNCVLADSLRGSWMDQKQTKNQVSEQRYQREISAAVSTLQDPLSDEVGSDIDGEDAGDKFGSSLDISGDGRTIAIGSSYNDGNGAGSGHVR
eukprot:5866249-Ditylum_brightwellii.AAC.1